MPRKNDYENMYLVSIRHENASPLPKGVILETLLRTSGDTVCVLKICIDWMEVWRDGALIKKVQTVREAFKFASDEDW